MTGVSRFAGLSVFSALNNLNDITMNNKYTSICGYTQEELENSFKEYIEQVGKSLELTYEETISAIKRWYNGYSWDGKTSVYNPFSTLLFFHDKKFSNYWFKTGTPTFLIDQIKDKDLKSFEQKQKVTEYMLSNFNEKSIDITGLLFQTGYLTIKKEMIVNDVSLYELDFPNREVKDSFLMILVDISIRICRQKPNRDKRYLI